MNATKTVRCECPSCGQPIEAEIDSERPGIKCPTCQTGFVPDSEAKRIFREQEERTKRSMPIRRDKSDAERLAASAERFEVIAAVFLFLGIVGCFLGATGPGAAWAVGIFGGALFWWAIFYFLAQVMHGRAQLAEISEALRRK